VELFRIAMLKSEPYKIVITDLGMPDMDGYLVARMIKAESPSTPIIMLTGDGKNMKPGGAAGSAVDAVVGKPPCIQELDDLLLRMAG
jgi:DNA-binding response OmpR family regulator